MATESITCGLLTCTFKELNVYADEAVVINVCEFLVSPKSISLGKWATFVSGGSGETWTDFQG